MTKTTDTVRRAEAFAREALAGVLDKRGKPVLDHVARVAAAALPYGGTAVAVAWLHDVVEDSAVTVDAIEACFGPEIARAVDALTRRKRDETYEAYIERVAANPLAVGVKLCDLADNLARCHELPHGADLATRYTAAVRRLLDDKAGAA